MTVTNINKDDLRETGSHTINVEQQPTSLHALADSCLVGHPGQIDVISTTRPSHTLWQAAPELRFKPIDFFVRSESSVLAVDDIAFPFHAVRIRLDDHDQPTSAETIRLPSAVMAHFCLGTARDSTFWLMYRFHSGHVGPGNEVFSIRPFAHHDSSLPEYDQDGSAVDYDWPSITGDAIPMDERTHWRGMAAIGDHLLIAAGNDGLFDLPLPLPSDGQTRATRILAERPCLDVVEMAPDVCLLLCGSDDESSPDRFLRWLRLENGRVQIGPPISVPTGPQDQAGNRWIRFVR